MWLEWRKTLVTREAGGFEESSCLAEYFLPFAVDALLQQGKASVQVLTSQDKWYGVTYKEDKEMVVNAIAGLKKQGLYPEEF